MAHLVADHVNKVYDAANVVTALDDFTFEASGRK